MRWIGAQITEVERDPVLRWYGALLALVHVLTHLWWRDRNVLAFLHRDAEPICWPLLQQCERLRVLSVDGIRAVLTAYVGLAVASALLFLQRERVRWAYGCLVALEIVKLGVVALDFRLRLNQHYMAWFVAFTFLFVPRKRDAIRVLVCLFYFWAGTLKLSWDWISGAALYRPVWLFEGTGLVVACAYVVLLELVIAWGLLARRAWIFWAALAQLVAFHVMSWPIVGFFYPVLMFLILSIFPLCRLRDPSDLPEGLFVWLARGRLSRPVYALGAFFSALQLVPWAFPGDRAITGEGRLFALHMFDGRTVCAGYAEIEGPDGRRTRKDLTVPLGTRTMCDPIVFYNRARNLCRRGDLRDLDLVVWAGRVTDAEMKQLIDIPSFCSKDIRYSPFRHNAWIRAD